jgi:hypothetical protein
MANWYTGSTKYAAVLPWAASTTYSVGQIVRQLATPAVNSERCFRVSAITTGISGAAEPTWTLTKNSTTTDSGVTWTECTGQAIYNGDGGGTAWAAPHARIANAVASGWPSAGDTIYVSNNHAATQASSINISPVGFASNGLNIICVSDTVVPPTTLATTASESTTGANSITVGSTGFGAVTNIFMYGVTFNAGSAANAASINLNNTPNTIYIPRFEKCSFVLNNTNSSSLTIIGQNSSNSIQDSNIVFKGCSFVFGSTGQSLSMCSCALNLFDACVFAGTGTVPTNLFSTVFGAISGNIIRDCDLSAVTTNLLTIGNNGNFVFNVQNSKLGSAVNVVNGTINSWGQLDFKVHNSDNAATNYRYYRKNYLGTEQQETTIVRTGGATDGTTQISHNVNTTANSNYYQPFVTEEITAWNDNSGSSKTATVYLTTNTTLNNNDFWIEIEYPSSSSNPQGATVTTRMALLGTPTALTTDSSTWGGSITNKYKCSVSFTPQMKGPVKARIYVAKPSVTIYVDPLLSIV